MTPQEIVTQLRKIATYSTSKKEVCTQAADLIEKYKEGLSIIRSVIFDYDGYNPKNAEQMKALVDECFGMCGILLNGDSLTVSPEDFDKKVKVINNVKYETNPALGVSTPLLSPKIDNYNGKH